MIMIGEVSTSLSDYLADKSYSSIGVIVDEKTRRYCLPLIEQTLGDHHVIEIMSGEENKSLETCQYIWTKMANAKMDRHGLLINLGGGVIGDMGGFAASCYMRGMDFIQIPTTLLSQVDASVGGKLAVDFQSYKNFIGLFCNPKTVLIDPKFLDTLPPRELRSGYAEIIKHGLIHAKPIWDRLSTFTELATVDWPVEIADSVEIKKEVVSSDPKEQGLRKILNFGHTIGHALESFSLGSEEPLLHGEAIAIGMVAEAYLSHTLLSLSEISLNTITQYIKQIYHDLPLSSLDHLDEVFVLMGADKKNKGGEVRTSLLKEIGEATFDITLQKEDVERALAFTKVALS